MADQAAQNLLRTEFEAAIAVDPMEDTDTDTADDKADEINKNTEAGDPFPNNGALTVSDRAEQGLRNKARVINRNGGL